MSSQRAGRRLNAAAVTKLAPPGKRIAHHNDAISWTLCLTGIQLVGGLASREKFSNKLLLKDQMPSYGNCFFLIPKAICAITQ